MTSTQNYRTITKGPGRRPECAQETEAQSQDPRKGRWQVPGEQMLTCLFTPVGGMRLLCLAQSCTFTVSNERVRLSMCVSLLQGCYDPKEPVQSSLPYRK